MFTCRTVLGGIIAAVIFVTPVTAQITSGAEAKAYDEAVQKALTGVDPTASLALHELAEAGNVAAVALLPFAMQWTPPKGSLKERAHLRKISGVSVSTLAADLHPASAAWAAGEGGAPQDLISRAETLIAIGEPAKADLLLLLYLQATGLGGEIPDVFLAQDRPDWLLALGLSSRLMFQSEPGDGPLLAELLRQDRLGGWMTLAKLRAENRAAPFERDIAPVLEQRGPTDVSKRMDDAAALTALAIAGKRERPVTQDAVLRARGLLVGQAGFSLVEQFCKDRCPTTTAACETAFLAYPGVPVGYIEALQPFGDLVPTARFLSSDAGLSAMIQKRNDPAAHSDLAMARALDGCFAAQLDRAESLQTLR